jgi:hypothetical protein
LKPNVLKPDVLKPDVLKPDVLWVYLVGWLENGRSSHPIRPRRRELTRTVKMYSKNRVTVQ